MAMDKMTAVRLANAIAAAAILLSSPILPADEQYFSEQDMGVITRTTANILVREHYSKKTLDDDASAKLFDEYLRALDPSKIYFTKEDIASLAANRNLLDDQILKGDIKFAFVVHQMLSARISDFNKFSEKALASGMDFSLDEEWTPDRSEADWPANSHEREDLWRRKIKNDILTSKLMLRAAEKDATKNSQSEEELLWTKAFKPEDRVMKRYANYLRYFREDSPIDKLERYLNSLAMVFDPYSAYMAPKSVEDFNIQMSLSLTGIGATLSQQDGYTKIVDLVPGGPAEASGKLHPGDRIIAVAQQGEEPVDVVDMPLSKVVSLIRGKKDSVVLLTILSGKKGLGAPPAMVEIKRDKITLKDQEAQSEIIEHQCGTAKTRIGVVKLESFYFDWNAAEKGLDPKSSTSDVRKILESFNSKKIDGLIMDLRSNGGGSLFEAITLTGLFIKNGPVVQVRSRDDKTDVKFDVEDDIAYSGPMMVMVNRLSASASEIFAAAIRDHGRGIIVGDSHTFGKGTVQTVMDLELFLKYWGMNGDSGSVKITNAKFYRINGSSTQRNGIISDIVLPSISDSDDFGESRSRNSLEWDCIAPVKFEKWRDDQSMASRIEALGRKSSARVGADPDFAALQRTIEQYRKFRDRKTVSLNMDKRFKSYEDDVRFIKEQEKLLGIEDDDSPEESSRKKIDPKRDIQLRESLNIMGDYIQMDAAPRKKSTQQARASKK